MTKYQIVLIVMVAVVATAFFGYARNKVYAQISFESLQTGKPVALGKPQYLKAVDGVELAYFEKRPAKKPEAALIFIHGGGACSEAGYQYPATGLSEKYAVAVYLMDVRGHGRSGGPRGDAPSVEQVWDDVRLMIETVRKNHPDVPLYLGGHSSGAGLILNYLTSTKRAPVDGYFLLSPQLGDKSATARPESKSAFFTARTWVFVVSALSGGKLFAHKPAVILHYPEAVLKANPLMLRYYTRNMALALTPDHPQEQFKNIDRRFGIFIGGQDELFVPEKVIQYADHTDPKIKTRSVHQIIPGEKHLSILRVADDLIGKTIRGWQK